jgi:hypothetical protein
VLGRIGTTVSRKDGPASEGHNCWDDVNTFNAGEEQNSQAGSSGALLQEPLFLLSYLVSDISFGFKNLD